MSTRQLSEQVTKLTEDYEKRVDPVQLTHNETDPKANASTGVDYEPYPERSLKVSAERQAVVDSICRLYSGSASDPAQGERDCHVYAEAAIYDDPWSYCDTRKKIAGQWYGIPMAFSKTETLKTEIVENTDDHLVFKLQQAYTPRVAHFTKTVNSLVTLSFDAQGKVKYHKDQWNEKDYSHEGLGKIFKTLNGDHLPKVTKPADSL